MYMVAHVYWQQIGQLKSPPTQLKQKRTSVSKTTVNECVQLNFVNEFQLLCNNLFSSCEYYFQHLDD